MQDMRYKTMTPTLSTLRKMIYELDAASKGDSMKRMEFLMLEGNTMLALIREQHRLLMEAKGIIEECHDQLWHLAKEPESNVLVQKAKAFLRQLEESNL